MAEPTSWDHLVSAQIDRCVAFEAHLQRLRGHAYRASLPGDLLSLLQTANEGIIQQLESLLDSQELAFLDDSEAEDQIIRFAHLYHFLYEVASFIERVAGTQVASELYMPLRRLLTVATGETDLLFYPIPAINYVLVPLGSRIRNVMSSLKLPVLPEKLQREQVYAIGFPGLQPKQFLVHSLLAHEVGHAVYSDSELKDAVLGAIQIEPKELVSSVGSNVQDLARLLATTVKTISSWAKEIACDAIGFYILGPAFLISAIEFLPLLNRLDGSSEGYPPTRLRLRFLLEQFEERLEGYDAVDQFLSVWREQVFKKRSVLC